MKWYLAISFSLTLLVPLILLGHKGVPEGSIKKLRQAHLRQEKATKGHKPVAGNNLPSAPAEKETGEPAMREETLTIAVGKAIKKFQTLGKKTLRSKEEGKDYQELLAEPALLAAQKDILLQLPRKYNVANEAARMLATDYLIAALSWQDNPNWQEVNATLQAILSNDEFMKLPNERLLKSIAGDRIELFGFLLDHYPEVAEEVLARSEGTAVAKLMQLANRMHR